LEILLSGASILIESKEDLIKRVGSELEKYNPFFGLCIKYSNAVCWEHGPIILNVREGDLFKDVMSAIEREISPIAKAKKQPLLLSNSKPKPILKKKG
jgi:hypothetical protein